MKFNFYHNVETADGSHSNSVLPAEVMDEARKLHAETGKEIQLEIVLEQNGQIYYEDDKLLSERIVLIPAPDVQQVMDAVESGIQVFEFKGELAPEGAQFNRWTADELRGNVAVRVYDREMRRCQLDGVVTEAYQYGGMTILAVWDADEPLAWSLILNADGSVTHYDKQYDILVVGKEKE